MKVGQGDMLERLVQGIAGSAQAPVQKSSAGPEGFSRLLEEMIRQDPAGKDAQIDKDKLAIVLELVKIQMTQSVMSTLAGDGDEGPGSDLGFLFGMPDMQGLSQDESKIQQSEGPVSEVQAPKDLDAIIDKASSTYGVDRDLIVSVIRAESGFDANATSPKGAMGLMQLMPDTARGLGVRDAYDPEQNVMAGTRYLKGLLSRYNGDVRLALAAYNWGMGNLERSTGRLPEETRNYIARIMKSYGGTQG
jgi:membrane-bound lytic murein transglycosylase B